MEHVIEIIKTNSKKPKIAHIGYLYHFQKECSNFIRWRCSKFTSLKCPSVLKTSLDIEKPIFIIIDHDHVHTSNKNAVAALKLKNKMNEKAQISYATPSQIFAESVSNVPHEVLVELPKEEHVKRTIRNHRGYNDPSKPACRKELIGIKHPTVWHLIRKMKYEVASDYAKLALDDIGETNMKTTKLGQMRTTEIRLKELCARFVSGKINISDFLNSISHNIRKQSNN
uniref:FLYWCH-type domain-containing protein n=1 Tax=Schizaphis graminum TaxID=13262 RepID=A0A2S2NMR4_SCHGA